MIEVAIQNVACAGYLGIIPDATVIKADQTSSQQSVKSDSKFKKRTQKEMEQGEEQTKKRAKKAVPAREQSSRYDVDIFSPLC